MSDNAKEVWRFELGNEDYDSIHLIFIRKWILMRHLLRDLQNLIQ